MWTRGGLKAKAKEMLRGTYWQAFLVSLVIASIGGHYSGASSGGLSVARSIGNIFKAYFNLGILTNTSLNVIVEAYLMIIITFIVTFLIFILITGIIAMAIRVFIGYALEVGGRKYYIQAAEGESMMGYLGFCFKDGRYSKILGAMLLRSLYTILWSLLLIIPGIIKWYAYRMVPYILSDNPDIGAKRAIELSNEMTKGEKLDMFILDLSFVGWYFLGAFAFGLGVAFVKPYEDATNTQLYLYLRDEAVKLGLTTTAELNFVQEVECYEF